MKMRKPTMNFKYLYLGAKKKLEAAEHDRDAFYKEMNLFGQQVTALRQELACMTEMADMRYREAQQVAQERNELSIRNANLHDECRTLKAANIKGGELLRRAHDQYDAQHSRHLDAMNQKNAKLRAACDEAEALRRANAALRDEVRDRDARIFSAIGVAVVAVAGLLYAIFKMTMG